jgi:hypothetical protein
MLNLRNSIFVACLLAATACSDTAAVRFLPHREVVAGADSALKRYNGLSAIEGGFAIYDKEHGEELFFDEDGKLLRRVRLVLPDSLVARRADLWVTPQKNFSALFLLPETRLLLQCDSSGKIIRQWNVNVPLADGSSDYALVQVSQSPPVSDGKFIYATCARLDVVVNNVPSRQIYFRTPPDMQIPIDEGAAVNCGAWPAEYKTGDNYRDYYPQRCINSKGQVVCAFEACDSIFVLEKGRLVSTHAAMSRYITPRSAFPDDSTGHFDYLERFDIEQPRYHQLSYDPFRHLYYRVVHHACIYANENGITVNEYFDKPWSVMVLDEAFNVLSEIRFDPKLYLPQVFPVRSGVLIRKREKANNKPPIRFTLFSIEQ